MDVRIIKDRQVLQGMFSADCLSFKILDGQCSLKDHFFGRYSSSSVELRIPNGSLESFVGAGGANLAEIRQVTDMLL